MDKEDNFYLLFEQKINDDLFDMNDTNLKNQKVKAKQSQIELMTFINANLNKEKLELFEELLEKRDDNYHECFYLEGYLYYKHGINDGFSMCLSSLNNNINSNL